jgi:hypothetical protein
VVAVVLMGCIGCRLMWMLRGKGGAVHFVENRVKQLRKSRAAKAARQRLRQWIAATMRRRKTLCR